MAKAQNIHNLDSLEKEIYRLKLEVKKIEVKLDENLDHVQENFTSMVWSSFFHNKKDKNSGSDNVFESFLKNEKLNTVVNKVTDRIADRAAEGMEKLIDRIFNKKKHHSNG